MADHMSIEGTHRYGLLAELLSKDNAYVKGDGVLPYIPEISTNLNQLVVKIISGIHEVVPKDNTMLILGWCCYAGIGATMHWHLNWSQLRQKGIFETLTDERGLSEMDEYVLDYIGLPFQGSAAKKLTEHIKDCGKSAIVYMAKHSINSPQDVIKNVFLQSCEAMYFYGMAIQMKRLGL